ncbi:hypothetical protein GGI17_001849 [Coemansia sp. S146]|nr:hypothetical protein GGI17_001849 [Coemansia sp. S146]
MSDNKASSFRRPILSYAETAKKCSNRSTSSADATLPAPGTGVSAAVPVEATGEKQNQHGPSPNGASGLEVSSDAASGAPVAGRTNRGTSKGADYAAAVRLPARNSVSSAAAPAIQLGSLNQQVRPPSPPAAQCATPATAVITSGGVPAVLAKLVSKPSFGSIQSNSEDNAANQPTGSHASSISSTADSSAHTARRGRKQQQRSASRSTGHNQQVQAPGPGRKNGPKPHHPPHNDGGCHVNQPLTMATSGMPGPYSQANMGAQQQSLPHYANSPYYPQGHSNLRFPAKKGFSSPYTPQAVVHYPPHHMGAQPMTQPMGYGMQPMPGWIAPLPHQYAYMHMGGPGHEQYYLASQGAGGSSPHNMYGMPNYSVPSPTHTIPSQIGAPDIMQGPMGGAPMPGMTASLVAGQYHHGANGGLRATAQAFIPGRRPVRIVNPNTNEEIDLSQQCISSASSATPAPGPGPVVEKCETAAASVEPALAETADVPAADEENIVMPVDGAVSEAPHTQPECSDAETDVIAKAILVETTEAAAITIESMIKEAVSEPMVSFHDEEKPASLSVEEEHAVDDEEEHKSDLQDTPPPTSPSSSSQVTFSEPSSATRRALTSAEILELYPGDSDVPVLVGEILRYPRVFLDRFNGLCEPPLGFDPKLVDIDDPQLEDRSSGMRRSASGSNRSRDPAPQSGFGGMGNFRHTRTPNSSASSEERFRQSTNEFRGRMDGGRDTPMGSRPPSGQFRGPGGRENRDGRTSSTRGGREGSSGRGRHGGRGGSQHGRERADTLLIDLANVKPLEKSEDRYIAKSLRIGKDAVEDDMQEEVFNRAMRKLLNKLTPDNFDTVSDELATWGNKSVNETDARMLRHLVMLVYQKAIDEPDWANMYARLCHKLICNTDMQIEDHNLLTKDGKYLCGGFIVRKYLLTKCQEEYERGWKVKMPEDMESEEYCNAAKIKRQGLGLVCLVGELFLLDILKPPILHECVKRLLFNFETPEEEETLSLAKLLTTAGKKLDVPADKDLMDAYFVRVQAMSVNVTLLKRVRFTLIDVLELRKNRWVPRLGDTGPKTIAEIHEEAERKKQAEAALYPTVYHPDRRSEPNSGRGDGSRGRYSGRTAIGGSSGSGRNDQNQHVGDLSGFGNLSRSQQQRGSNASTPISNPFSAFAGGSRGWSSSSLDNLDSNDGDLPQSLALGPGRRASSNNSLVSSTVSTPRSVSTRNMFDLLIDEEEEESPVLAPVEVATSFPKKAESTMDTETMQRKINYMIDEYMGLKDDVEFIECFKELGEVNYQMAVFEIANNVMYRRPAHVEQVARGLEALCAGNVLIEDVAVAGLVECSEMLEDTVIDAPNAYKFFGMLINAAHVPRSCISDEVLKLIN